MKMKLRRASSGRSKAELLWTSSLGSSKRKQTRCCYDHQSTQGVQLGHAQGTAQAFFSGLLVSGTGGCRSRLPVADGRRGLWRDPLAASPYITGTVITADFSLLATVIHGAVAVLGCAAELIECLYWFPAVWASPSERIAPSFWIAALVEIIIRACTPLAELLRARCSVCLFPSPVLAAIIEFASALCLAADIRVTIGARSILAQNVGVVRLPHVMFGALVRSAWSPCLTTALGIYFVVCCPTSPV